MIVTVDSGAGIVRKQAETGEERDRLRREAQVLDLARHPGVVQLLGAGTDTLTLRLVDGVPLSRLPALSPAQMARIAAEVATTLADLHDIGVVHGAVSADHVLIDSAGRTVLCSLGRATVGSPESSQEQGRRVATDGPRPAAFRAAAEADVAALAGVLAAAAPADSDVGRILRTAIGAPGGPWPARRLATLLTTPPHDRSGGASRSKVVGAVVAIVMTATAIALVAPTLASAPTHHRAACPLADHGCRPLARTDGVIQTAVGRYRLGRRGDLVVVGRWHCGDALPALLRPATGEVWVWDGWAPATGPLAARLVVRIPKARTLTVAPGSSGCDGLTVQRAQGGPVAIRSLKQP